MYLSLIIFYDCLLFSVNLKLSPCVVFSSMGLFSFMVLSGTFIKCTLYCTASYCWFPINKETICTTVFQITTISTITSFAIKSTNKLGKCGSYTVISTVLISKYLVSLGVKEMADPPHGETCLRYQKCTSLPIPFSSISLSRFRSI